MPFDWDAYKSLAVELKDSTDEAKRRSAVSRGYYAVYHKSRIRLNFTSAKYIPHKQVIESLLNNDQIENGASLSNTLAGLSQSRSTADYHSFTPVDQGFVREFWARLERYERRLGEAFE